MNKLAVGVLSAGAFAVLATLGTSYYMGGKIEHAFEQSATDWSTQDDFTVTVLEYQRGIWGSEAKTLWSLKNEEESLDITATHHITHGPWANGHAGHIDSHFSLPDDSDPDLLQSLQGRPFLQWQTQIAWKGTTDHTLTSPNITVNFADGSDLVWGGMLATMHLSAERTAAHGKGHMPSLLLKSDNGSRLELQDTSMEFSGAIVPGHSFWDGPANMKIASMKIFEPEGGATVSVQGLALDSTTSANDDVVNTALNMNLAQLDAPGYRTSGVALNLSLKNIDANWMDQLVGWTNGRMQDETYQMELMRSLPVLLGRKPEIAIERFAVQTPEGQSELSARVTYQGDNPQMFNPMTDLHATLKASMPKALLALLMGEKVRGEYLDLLEQLGQEVTEEELEASVRDGVNKRMTTLLHNGIVQAQGDTVQTELEYAQGEIKLNGKITPLNSLMGIGGAL